MKKAVHTVHYQHQMHDINRAHAYSRVIVYSFLTRLCSSIEKQGRRVNELTRESSQVIAFI